MKILVFADSHGRTLGMYDAIERETPDAVIHLGDYTEDACDLERSYPSLPLWYVRGNNDYDPETPLCRVISPDGIPFYLTHGHREHVTMSSLGNLVREAASSGCRMALYGHTHRIYYEQVGDLLILNPGSISLPRGGVASYARIETENGKLRRVTLLDTNGGLYRPLK